MRNTDINGALTGTPTGAATGAHIPRFISEFALIAWEEMLLLSPTRNVSQYYRNYESEMNDEQGGREAMEVALQWGLGS